MIITFYCRIDKIPKRICDEQANEPATICAAILLVAADPIKTRRLRHETGEEKWRRVNNHDQVDRETPVERAKSKFSPREHRDVRE